MESTKHFKAFNFDLDTNKLKLFFNPYTDAYSKLRSVLKKHGFEHRQGSGYISEKQLDDNDVYIITKKIAQQCPWLATCAKEFDVTNIDKNGIYSALFILQGKTSPTSTMTSTQTNKVQNGLILQASQFWAFEKTTIGKKLHNGFTILSNPENQWFLLKDGLPKNNGDELAIGDKTTIDDVVAQYSSESRKDMITRFDSKQDAIDYWHKHSAEYSAMREQYPELNEYTKKAQDAIDELLPAEFKTKTSGSSARRTSRPASSSGRDERGH